MSSPTAQAYEYIYSYLSIVSNKAHSQVIVHSLGSKTPWECVGQGLRQQRHPQDCTAARDQSTFSPLIYHQHCSSGGRVQGVQPCRRLPKHLQITRSAHFLLFLYVWRPPCAPQNCSTINRCEKPSGPQQHCNPGDCVTAFPSPLTERDRASLTGHHNAPV